MTNNRTIRKRKNDIRTVNKRGAGVFTLIVALTSIIGYRVYDLQTTHHEHGQATVKRNAIKELYLSPERGDILDRNGVELANTRPFYDLVVLPERINGYRRDRSQSITDFLDTLSHFLEITDKEKRALHRDIHRSASYKPVVLKQDLDEYQLSGVLSNIAFVDGLAIESKKVRHYPYGEAFLTPLGYVGRVDRQDLEKASEVGYRLLSSDFSGKAGLESIYNERLYGTAGVETVALNSRGTVVERQIATQPEKGENLKLTIDSELQIKARELMGDKRGAIIMNKVDSGETLVLLSTPTLDPTMFIGGLSKDQASQVFSEEAGRPLYNRATRGQYPPASTIKPFVALAGASGKYITPDERVWSGPHFELGGHRFRDWKRDGHGWVDMISAMEVSSDVYFYRLVNRIGIDYLHDYLAAFGFGKVTGIDQDRESSALLPSRDWKRRVKKEPWYDGETITVGIGQGYFMATPMQVQMAYVTLLNGGKRLRPTLLLDDETEVLADLRLDESATKAILKGLDRVITGDRGTARAQSYQNIVVPFAGKTGTGQVISSAGTLDYENEDLPVHMRDHAWFTGYVPADNPEVVVTILVENGTSGSSVAAPMARKLLNEYSKRYIVNDQ